MKSYTKNDFIMNETIDSNIWGQLDWNFKFYKNVNLLTMLSWYCACQPECVIIYKMSGSCTIPASDSKISVLRTLCNHRYIIRYCLLPIILSVWSVEWSCKKVDNNKCIIRYVRYNRWYVLNMLQFWLSFIKLLDWIYIINN